ncbi:CDP-diacylglycerol pyrophosphatase [Roseiarcus fermentans]|uniref:CDP-diacylglycerol pyrophosphatase n=1 Tax=Roseiarcus fermentans TaxID=1473586 RepID=A0A366EET9_9HYPH|nr:CDP-diacylglycerol diphosphatase [Roseiarcus fermentans]RBP00931.1 CDP-diacylglycerol pyrophosphatase [Roseiarcus fermentans]
MRRGESFGHGRLGRPLALAAAALAATAFAALAAVSFRGALWPVVRACVAAERLTGRPFPCLAVDLVGGEAGGWVVLRPPWSNDLILSPTRQSVGVEDPFLQSGEAPNYFAAAWRARDRIAAPEGGGPSRDRIALIVNPGEVRSQDQLHIHIGCLVPWAQRLLGRTAAASPPGVWRPIGALIPGRLFWALRVRSADLADVDPFRLARDQVGPALTDPADLMVAVVGVAAEDEFLILASAAHSPRSSRPVGAEALLDKRCRDRGFG